MAWLSEEAEAAAEDQIQRVMRALDVVSEGEPPAADWNDHLRALAVAAVRAM